jgi:hypothetical protein
MDALTETLSKGLTRCDKCQELRTHSTQDGFELPDGTVEWRGEKNGCKRHPAVAIVHKLDGTTEEWKES